MDTYHGYGIQDFLQVDPRFGTTEDLRELVQRAHERGLYVILDIILNHTGDNWGYPGDYPYYYWPEAPGPFDFGFWRETDTAPVITSYSIHYTKLYEVGLQQQIRRGDPGAEKIHGAREQE